MSASLVFRTLRDRFDLSSLPAEDLKRIAQSSDSIEDEMRNLTEVMTGLGCLINHDANIQGGCGAGNLQDGMAVSLLLFFFAEALQTQVEALHVASNAEYHMNERQLAKTGGAS